MCLSGLGAILSLLSQSMRLCSKAEPEYLKIHPPNHPMKRKSLALGALALTFSLGSALAAPIAISNHSFESPDLSGGGATWTNNFPDWPGRAANSGAGDGQSFVELINGFFSEGAQHIGMQSGTYHFQDTGVAFAANTRYTLTIGLGNRNGNNGVSGFGLTNTVPPSDGSSDMATLIANDAVLNANNDQINIQDLTGNGTFLDRTVVMETGDTPPLGT